MIGTIVNAGLIVVGSVIGSVFKKGMKESYQDILMQAMGLAVTALGIYSLAKHMPNSQYPVLFIVSLALGGIIGEKLNMEERFKTVVSRFSKGNLAEGLSTAVLLFCIGTLSIVGPIESALNGNQTYLFTNAILDLVTSIVLAATFGIGIALSAIVLFCWQGFFYVAAGAIAGWITPALLTEISIVGAALILSSGLSILGIKKFKTMNLIPALLVPALFIAVKSMFGL
ncbi:UNVERIFIED_CONTAM: putative membrane protein YqgA involved in biofilm formation [Brevibacillus sp. OAP136]